jgi:iron complex transport system substrate-binding protein
MIKRKTFTTNHHEPILRLVSANIYLLLLLTFLLAGCTAKSAVAKNDVKRVISTAPSNTEIIADLGQAYKLVAVDVHSANVEGIPANLPLLDFFYPDAEVIINLSPDLIIASGHNPTGSGEDPFRLLRDMGVQVVYISMSKSIAGIYEDITLIAELLQAEEEGKALISKTSAMIDEIANAALAAHASSTAQMAAGIKNKKTVYFEISTAPDMMTFGKDSFIHDMIITIGAENIFGKENWLVTPGAETIINRNPDVILTNVSYIDDPIGEIKSRPGFNHINAVKNNRIYRIDTDSSVRPSARVVKALRQMQEAIYPEDFTQRH